MMAKSAAPMTIIHFAQAAGHQTMAITMIAAANKKRQKHNFMISVSFLKRFSLSYKKRFQVSSLIIYARIPIRGVGAAL